MDPDRSLPLSSTHWNNTSKYTQKGKDYCLSCVKIVSNVDKELFEMLNNM